MGSERGGTLGRRPTSGGSAACHEQIAKESCPGSWWIGYPRHLHAIAAHHRCKRARQHRLATAHFTRDEDHPADLGDPEENSSEPLAVVRSLEGEARVGVERKWRLDEPPMREPRVPGGRFGHGAHDDPRPPGLEARWLRAGGLRIERSFSEWTPSQRCHNDPSRWAAHL